MTYTISVNLELEKTIEANSVSDAIKIVIGQLKDYSDKQKLTLSFSEIKKFSVSEVQNDKRCKSIKEI